MEPATLASLLALYVLLVMGFVFFVSRDPAAWAQMPQRATALVVLGLLVAGPLGALLVLLLMRRHGPRPTRPPGF